MTIRHLWPIWPALSPPNGAAVGGRPLLNLSYALNYAIGGTAVAGYHLVNLLIHVLAAWTLFAMVRRALLQPVLAKRFGSAATALALAVSAIWAWHPLQSESVTYLSERAELLMGLFYLLTLYCFIRGAESDEKGGSRIWLSLSVLACLAGVATKEIIVTAPLMVFLYDRTFISGSFSGAWRRHWPVYASLAATWLPIGWLMSGIQDRGVGFGQADIAWWAYGLAECRVIVKYLLLALWPHPLVFDYGRIAALQMAEVWPYALVLALLLTITVWALLCRPNRSGDMGGQALGFAGAWFFLILAPTSSLVPLAGAPMAESRLYLPLAGVVAFAVIGAFALAGRRTWPIFAIVAAALGLASVQRNQDYSSAQALWNDTVAKNPANPRAHNNLGEALAQIPGRLPDAVAQFEAALQLRPDYEAAHFNLGVTLLKLGRFEEAVAHLKKADSVRHRDNVHLYLGEALAGLHHYSDAAAEYSLHTRVEPGNGRAWYGLGNALAAQGMLSEAASAFAEAVRIIPGNPELAFALGDALAELRRYPEAAAAYRQGLARAPDRVEAHNNLGNVLVLSGQFRAAAAEFREALRLRPGDPALQKSLQTALEAEANGGMAPGSSGNFHQ